MINALRRHMMKTPVDEDESCFSSLQMNLKTYKTLFLSMSYQFFYLIQIGYQINHNGSCFQPFH